MLPRGFGFGIVSAATAVEGLDAARLDDESASGLTHAGASIWDVFAASPGRIVDGTTRADGPGHLRSSANVSTDVDLITHLGVSHSRISLSWSALTGAESGNRYDRYSRYIDDLLAKGVEVVVTLTHYDMPLTVMTDGGWLVRDTAEVFGDYAATVAAKIGDRVSRWVTMNSPLVHTAYGYGLGIEAPGLTMLGESLRAGINQLVGHGYATQALRASGAQQIGIANHHTRVRPASESREDIAAAELYSILHNRAFTDPLFGLGFPGELAGLIASSPDLDFASAADAHLVAQPLDFYGVNYHHPVMVAAATDNATIPFTLVEDPAAATDDAGWPLDPSALTQVLLELTAQYPALPPLYVTENGTHTAPGIDDADRCEYVDQHITAIAAAIRDGADVRGYDHWTLLDCWEFGEGLTRPMGLVAVDPLSQDRTPKASYHHYAALIAAHRARSY
ncbi:glycoside hydrolase family 1 protein [Nakamurella antarctica]|uniref:glycoside hydrolase family 1 protein n=1 Tax=Nakamurella antarctica TaxID=1902245 RepID=UPI0024117E1A|nr:glycoside hydrolase family 1 protein [Nakamurella antarctica]